MQKYKKGYNIPVKKVYPCRNDFTKFNFIVDKMHCI